MKWNRVKFRDTEDKERKFYPNCELIYEGDIPEYGDVCLVSYGDISDVWIDTWLEYDGLPGFYGTDIDYKDNFYWIKIPEINEVSDD